MQVFMPDDRHCGIRSSAWSGPLQFDVVEARMRSEYGIPCTLEPLPHVAGRWPVPESGQRQAPDADDVGRQDREGSSGA